MQGEFFQNSEIINLTNLGSLETIQKLINEYKIPEFDRGILSCIAQNIFEST
jgi:hypothetical protein